MSSHTDARTLLELQRTQISATVDMTEAACRQVIDLLERMHGEINRLGDSLRAAMEDSQEAIEAAGARVEESGAAHRELQDRLTRRRATVQKDVEAAGRVAEHVRSIRERTAALSTGSTQIRLLAINAKLEASRVAKNGGAFGVVATEMRAFADESASVSRSIEDDVGRLDTVVRDELLARAEETSRGQAAEEAAIASVGARLVDANDGALAMQRAHETVVGAAADASRNVGALLVEALGHMQFQDVLRQRLQHVVECLASARDTLAHEQAVDMGELARGYVSDAQRAAHADVLAEQHEEASGPAIELF